MPPFPEAPAATMYDGISAESLPPKALAVAGYVNGRYAWAPADWARFPAAAKVRIDVTGAAPAEASVVDVERYDATPAGAVHHRAYCFPAEHGHGLLQPRGPPVGAGRHG
jgi:hypothetical protein